MINEQRFLETYQQFDREIVVEIIDIFFEEYDERIEKINQQLKNKNIEGLQKSAHAFKGSIGNFETECRAYDEITRIETETHRALEKEILLTPENEDDFFEQLETSFKAFKRDSRQMLNQLKEIREKFVD